MDSDERDITTAEFIGYVKAKLEDIGKKLDKLEDCVGKMKLRVAAIGGTISLVVTMLILIIKELVSK